VNCSNITYPTFREACEASGFLEMIENMLKLSRKSKNGDLETS